MRTIININQDWRFNKGDRKAGAAETVNVPHCYNIEDGYNGSNYYRGAAFYERELDLDSLQGKRVAIEFNGVTTVAHVSVNGTPVGTHRGGYSSFRFDISDKVRQGRNRIEVVSSNAETEDVYPLMGDFTVYGGIYRDVNIILTDDVHFDLLDYASPGVTVCQRNVTAEAGELSIAARMVNDTDGPLEAVLKAEVFDHTGRSVASAEQAATMAVGLSERTLDLTVVNPELWQGVENPYLYDVRVSLETDGHGADAFDIKTGLRSYAMDPEKGFVLNGQLFRLHGASRHQDRKGVGHAITREHMEEDMRIMLEMGCTSVRLAHYQHDSYYYDLCDRYGLVAWAEIPYVSQTSDTDEEGLNLKQQLHELIKQNLNHSSIVCWGVQNEVQMTSDTPVSRRLTRELAALVKELDPTRLSTQANMSYVANDDEFNRMTDLVGYNRYEGWYSGQAEDFAPWLDTFHSDNPDIPLAISEYGAEGILAYHTDSPAVGDYTEEYHALLHETVWKIFEKRPFLWATYVWNMFDFGSAIRDEGGVKGMNNKGLVTFDRKIKKDAFYWYKAKWSKEPFVHITGRRYVERPQTQNAIKVYSNLKEVTLHLNEREIGTIQSSDGVFLFADVALEAGENRLEAVSGDCRDAIELRKVEHPNESYVCTQKQQGMSFSDNVANWNEKLAGINKDDIVITDDVYSTRDSFKDLFDNEEAKTAIVDLLGIDPSEKPMFKMAEKFSPDKIHQLKPDMMSEELLLLLNSRLTKIEKK